MPGEGVRRRGGARAHGELRGQEEAPGELLLPQAGLQEGVRSAAGAVVPAEGIRGHGHRRRCGQGAQGEGVAGEVGAEGLLAP